MTAVVVASVLGAVLAIALILLYVSSERRRMLELRIRAFQSDVVEASADALVGRRLAPSGNEEFDGLSATINSLLDALGERDAKLQNRDRLIADIARTLPEIVVIHDERILFANVSAAALLGVSPEQLNDRDVADLVKPAYRALFRKTMARLLGGSNEPRPLEIQLINGNEQGLWVEAMSSVIEYRGAQAVLTIARDVSYRKSLELSLSRSRRQAQYTLESISEGVITTDNEGRIDYLNRAAEEMTSAARDTAIGKKVGEIINLVDEADRRQLGDPVERCLAMRRRVNMGRRALMIGIDGDKELSVELSASPIRGPGNSISGTVIVFHDVSEIRGLTRQMSYQATHDPLTGLINRREFERRLLEAMDSAQAEENTHMLLYMDLDRFKAVNDSSGHLAGDNLLREIASLIKEQVRDSDFVGRLGGDEFACLLVGCPIEKAPQIASDICTAVGDYRFVWKDKVFDIGISIGLVEVTHTSGSLQDIMSAADSACYVAKQRGRGQVHIYSARDEAIARERGDIRWLRQMQAALHEDLFELAVQPIIATGAGTGTGPAVEVLLRLPDEQGQVPNSAEFLRSAERYQLMPQIDRWVIKATLTAISSGSIKLPAGRNCMINISSQAIGDEGFLSFIVDTLDRSSVSPSMICFELTESAISTDLQNASRFIEVLHGIGCEFALDDFGSRFGAFSNLKVLPVDYLKIDGSYTQNLASDSINQEMVTAMIKLARTMDFRIVAEQVEEQDDFDWLRSVGVDFVQGNVIEPPAMLGSGQTGTFRTLT